MPARRVQPLNEVPTISRGVFNVPSRQKILNPRYDPVMKDSRLPSRRSPRLAHYDYRTPGAYVVTACTQNRLCLFGEVRAGQMLRTPAGEMVATVWAECPAHYPGVDVDAFVVMPNHIHGLLWLMPGGALSVPDLMHRFKSLTTARYRQEVQASGWPRFEGRLWQRTYFEHIVRSEEALQRHRRYIEDNPAQWTQDRYYQEHHPGYE